VSEYAGVACQDCGSCTYPIEGFCCECPLEWAGVLCQMLEMNTRSTTRQPAIMMTLKCHSRRTDRKLH
ncbi:PREDICTED: protein serrate-like, partial [Rhagoletis zephyria]|uniref:protein serrate-like n=1 Tax=Rhagoletis zephyria TaxID=28612 RepID=UPI0008118CBA